MKNVNEKIIVNLKELKKMVNEMVEENINLKATVTALVAKNKELEETVEGLYEDLAGPAL